MTGSKFIYLHLPLVIDQNVVKTGNISPLFPLDNDKNLIFIILVSHPKNGTFFLGSMMYMDISRTHIITEPMSFDGKDWTLKDDYCSTDLS